ncbi:hypothetical protein ACTHT3_19305, partial [Neisseria sp. P0015.S004]
PPDGGWVVCVMSAVRAVGFNTQPPEGGWTNKANQINTPEVSTHSRPKAAGPHPRHQSGNDDFTTQRRHKQDGSNTLTL